MIVFSTLVVPPHAHPDPSIHQASVQHIEEEWVPPLHRFMVESIHAAEWVVPIYSLHNSAIITNGGRYMARPSTRWVRFGLLSSDHGRPVHGAQQGNLFGIQPFHGKDLGIFRSPNHVAAILQFRLGDLRGELCTIRSNCAYYSNVAHQQMFHQRHTRIEVVDR